MSHEAESVIAVREGLDGESVSDDVKTRQERKSLTCIHMKWLGGCLLRIYFPFPLNLLIFVVSEETHGNGFVPTCLFLVCILGAMFSNVSLINLCCTAKGTIVISRLVEDLLLDFALCGHAASEGVWPWSQNLQKQGWF